MIAAFAMMYRVLGDEKYLCAAEKACDFIEKELSDNDTLYVSFRSGQRGSVGFLDDYAFYIFALIQLYEASFKQKYLSKATELCKKAIKDFFDKENGGFYFYGNENEQLIIKPKEIYDGAVPSGNSVMAYNLVFLSLLTEDMLFSETSEQQLSFMAGKAKNYSSGHCFYLSALSMYINPPVHIVCALSDTHQQFPLNSVVKVIDGGNDEYPIINNRTTYYVCRDKACMSPVNDLNDVLK